MSKVLITGGTGMLGSVLREYFEEATILEGRKDLDLTNLNEVEKFLEANSFETIIHTAAFTSLQYNEDNPEQARILHSGIVDLFNLYCDKLIYISAQGKPYDSVYHKTKLDGEEKVLEKPNNLVIRTNIYGDGGLARWAYSELLGGKKINGYSNAMFNPVSVMQLSDFIYEQGAKYTDIVNVGTRTIISKYDFIKTLAMRDFLDTKLITPVEVDKFTDLTVNLENQFICYNLLDGLDTLEINI